MHENINENQANDRQQNEGQAESDDTPTEFARSLTISRDSADVEQPEELPMMDEEEINQEEINDYRDFEYLMGEYTEEKIRSMIGIVDVEEADVNMLARMGTAPEQSIRLLEGSKADPIEINDHVVIEDDIEDESDQ